MRTSKKLTLLALAVSMTALVGAVASPAAAEDPRSGPVVLTRLAPDVTMEQLHAQAEAIRGERLPAQASQLTIVDARQALSPDQLATMVAGRQADGARRLGDLRDPSPGVTLQDAARQIGVGDVVWWECYPVYVIIGGWIYVYWICRPLVLRA
ncbi:hypothetical protein Rhe02_58160 [Rhizocola hellebori]|uniref:Uncharacterized protein n=1 Tax=Rhizocola hellebori TaxID=1392758 RepID=A0A8J3VHT4_9ACTN|nr:hypothetical protein [Rhizocola hellebori]GIH07749.1 hypothetical protein Rhe02_58160 [Rhizocola hellebori]